MGQAKIRGYLHLLMTGFLFVICLFILVLVSQSRWPFDVFSAVLLLGCLCSVGFLLSWRGVANLRASQDLYLLSLIRKRGGRTTAVDLAKQAKIKVNRITRFLEQKVQRGQAFMLNTEEEVVYVFDGFLDQTGQNLQFRL